jgi:serine/threonine protein kinase/Flp pilus assembly protein TadD
MADRQSTAEFVEASRLDRLVMQVSGQIAAGQPVDLAAVTCDCPELREQLEMLLPTLEAMGQLGHSLGASASVPLQPPAFGLQPSLGDFRLIREIGRGGMGVVYEAEQLSLGRCIALKVLPFAAMLDKQQLARFKNEARAAATLDHPNIVAIHSVGVERGVHYYAMQLIEGESLAQVIARLRSDRQSRGADRGLRTDEKAIATADSPSPVPSPDSAIRNPQSEIPTAVAALSTHPDANPREYFRAVAHLGIQAAEALDHAHQNGVLHRDVKPANLLVECSHHAPRDEAAFKLWVTDFGLARLETDAGMTMTGDLIGTLRYMSPEQALAKRVVVDHRSDIYSLGATLYELLTLEPVYAGEDRQELLRQIALEEPVKPQEVDSRIPVDLQTIVIKAMEKYAADRYATAGDMADDLRRFVDHRPIHARPPSLIERAAKWTRRHRAMVSVGAAALTVSTLSLFVATVLTLRAYRGEAHQRTAAEANLRVASDSIDRMLSRHSNEQYVRGDLAHAETLAVDATEFYEKLLAHSDAPYLRFQAVEALNEVAAIWLLVDKPENALAASRRSLALLQPLIVANPDNAAYINARGAAYVSIGRAEWDRRRKFDADAPWRQAAADFQALVRAHPHDGGYQLNLAKSINNIGMYNYVYGDADTAKECFQRVIGLLDRLPQSYADTPTCWMTKAGALTNSAMLKRQQGDVDEALKLLAQGKQLLAKALNKSPTDPVAHDFLFNHCWHMAETSRVAGRPEAAAEAVEALVWALPERLDAYHYGAELLLQCAELAETIENPVPALAFKYRQRARELVAAAEGAADRTPERIERFAWFLVTCRDESLRDPARAIELAQSAAAEAPMRDRPWLTLALAHYRAGDWAAADEALQKSLERTPDNSGAAPHWLLQAMILFENGETNEAHRCHQRARDWLSRHHSTQDDTLMLAAEAATLLGIPQ